MKTGKDRRVRRKYTIKISGFCVTHGLTTNLFKNYFVQPSKNLKRKAKRYGGAAEERMGKIRSREDMPLSIRYAK